MKNKRIKKRQFSLLEVIIAITIIALVATIAVRNLSSTMDDANQKLATTQIHEFKGLVVTYKLATGRLPNSLQDLVTNESGAKGWKQQLEKLPVDPWNNPYVYSLAPETLNGFDIVSYGADGQAGGEGINKDVSLNSPEE